MAEEHYVVFPGCSDRKGDVVIVIDGDSLASGG
jgi:hypothetical protein